MNSMTGFGRSGVDIQGLRLTVEISSVNHKYLDLNFRMPRSLFAHQAKIRDILKKNANRGHLEVGVFIENKGKKDVDVNSAQAEIFLKALKALNAKLKLKDEITLEMVLHYSEAVKVNDRKEIGWPEMKPAVDEATKALVKSKEIEGKKLKTDLSGRIGTLEKLLEGIIKKTDEFLPEIKKKTEERIKNIFKENGVNIDEKRLCAEVSFIVEKGDVSEEMHRLNAHLTEFKRIMNDKGQVGRRLDFLVQEIMREINTLGAKSGSITVSHAVVAFKEETERIREQVQNVE
jgi:uncharacterized protein (TIGR00255 family)